MEEKKQENTEKEKPEQIDANKPLEEKTPDETTKKERKVTKRKKIEKEELATQQTNEKTDDKKEEPKTTRKRKKKSQAVVARGKRKESIARATITPGKGNVRINHMKLDAYYSNKYIREIVRQPLNYLGPEALNVDISVNVLGGGAMGQAQATRTAIANALVEYFPDQKLKEKFLEIDRSLLIEDVRRVETKKFKGPKARARFQKSYR